MTLPGDMAASVVRPKMAIQKKASDPNFSAMPESGSKNRSRSSAPTTPPKAEASRAVYSPSSALPCCVMA